MLHSLRESQVAGRGTEPPRPAIYQLDGSKPNLEGILNMDGCFALPVRADQIIGFADREEWLAYRSQGIGGSEAATVLGVPGSFGSRIGLWAVKTGRVPADDLSNVERVKWGNRLESAILLGYAEETGRSVISWSAWLAEQGHEPMAVVRHADQRHLFCTPDGVQHDEWRGTGLVQIKTAHSGKLADWSGDEPPLAYAVQVQHEMACTGAQWCSLACLVGGNALRWFDIERDEAFIKAMTTAHAAFWHQVLDGEMPEPDGSDDASEALKRMFPRDHGAEITLADDFIEIDRNLCDLKDQAKAIAKRIELFEQQIKAAMGDASTARCGDAVYSWKSSTRKAYTVAESEVRRFTRKEV